MKTKAILYIVIPCYNEEKVLPITSKLFLQKLKELIENGKIDEKSRIMFVNDGSKDSTWDIISNLAKQDEHYIGISQSRNYGHQNSVLAGMMESKDQCDIIISVDCDGQDDLNAMDSMIENYLDGCEIVYGVRSNRDKDSFWKKTTAESYYKCLQFMGAEVVYNHADYRLLSSCVLQQLEKFTEVNLFLRGIIPLVGFKSVSCVASCYMLILTDKLSVMAELSKQSRLIVVSIIAFTPAFFLTASRTNPDALVGLFMTLAFYLSLKWFRNPSWKYILPLAFVYGLGMMTKVSCGALALFTAILFVLKLCEAIKKKQWLYYMKQYIVFGLISLPLGLWYSVRNYILFDQPLGYVLQLTKESQIYIGDYSIVNRLFSFDLLNLLRTPYAHVQEDFNYPVYMIKSALFGEMIFQVPGWIPVILLAVATGLWWVIVFVVIWHLRQKNKNQMNKCYLGVSIIYLANMCWFLLRYPFACSMDYRYMLFLTIPLAILLGMYLDVEKKLRKICYVMVLIFGIFSCIFCLRIC